MASHVMPATLPSKAFVTNVSIVLVSCSSYSLHQVYSFDAKTMICAPSALAMVLLRCMTPSTSSSTSMSPERSSFMSSMTVTLQTSPKDPLVRQMRLQVEPLSTYRRPSLRLQFR